MRSCPQIEELKARVLEAEEAAAAANASAEPTGSEEVTQLSLMLNAAHRAMLHPVSRPTDTPSPKGDAPT